MSLWFPPQKSLENVPIRFGGRRERFGRSTRGPQSPGLSSGRGADGHQAGRQAGRQAGMGRGRVLAPRHEVCGWLLGVVRGASESGRGHFLHSSALSENGAAHRF